MNNLIIELQPYIIGILGILLSFLGAKLNLFLNAKIDEEKQNQIRDIVKGAVLFVEQVSKVNVELEGKEKYNFAKAKALKIINERGFIITENELDMLIESFVISLTNKGDEPIG